MLLNVDEASGKAFSQVLLLLLFCCVFNFIWGNSFQGDTCLALNQTL